MLFRPVGGATAGPVIRILHFADLHLDRSFAGLGMALSEATKRREELRAALRRIIDLAIELGVDALTVGGDLYEHEHVTLDTGNFIADQFQRLAPRPVMIAPGNHDPFVPDSLYRRLQWPTNVHVFSELSWSAWPLPGGVTIWGVGHNSPSVRDNLLKELRVNGDREMSIALVHASDVSAVPEGKLAHCPFQREDVERSGVSFTLLGHYHDLRLRPADNPLYGYPGSPEPLGFGEEGPHHVLLLSVAADAVAAEPVRVNEVIYESAEVDITGVVHSDRVREAIKALAGEQPPSPAIVRVTLIGQAEPDLDLDVDALVSGCAQHFRYLDRVVNRTEQPFDLAAIEDEATTRGAFVRAMRQRIAATGGSEREVMEQALQYGLQAFAGHEVRRR